MSRMKNPPLIEVIFDLKWQPGIIDEQLLIGAMYMALKDRYPDKSVKDTIAQQLLLPNVVAYRFTASGNKNKLYQLGSGVLTVNFIGPDYDWNDFKSEVEYIVSKFSELSRLNGNDKIRVSLTYIDFFDIDFINESVQDFIRDNLHVSLSTELLTTKYLSLKMSDSIDRLGVYDLAINTGYKNQKEKGVVVESKITVNGNSKIIAENFEAILNTSHSFLHNQFQKMIDGPMTEKLNA